MKDEQIELLKQQYNKGRAELLKEFDKLEKGEEEGLGLTPEIKDKMVLPSGCYLVERAKTDLGVLVTGVEPTYKDYGEIVFAAEDIEEYIGDTVYFKTSHIEEITINRKKYLYFTNLGHSIYYILER